jgi:hypothetical protein
MGTRCAAVCQNPIPYQYPHYPFWKHRGFTHTRTHPYTYCLPAGSDCSSKFKFRPLAIFGSVSSHTTQVMKIGLIRTNRHCQMVRSLTNSILTKTLQFSFVQNLLLRITRTQTLLIGMNKSCIQNVHSVQWRTTASLQSAREEHCARQHFL